MVVDDDGSQWLAGVNSIRELQKEVVALQAQLDAAVAFATRQTVRINRVELARDWLDEPCHLGWVRTTAVAERLRDALYAPTNPDAAS